MHKVHFWFPPLYYLKQSQSLLLIFKQNTGQIELSILGSDSMRGLPSVLISNSSLRIVS